MVFVVIKCYDLGVKCVIMCCADEFDEVVVSVHCAVDELVLLFVCFKVLIVVVD